MEGEQEEIKARQRGVSPSELQGYNAIRVKVLPVRRVTYTNRRPDKLWQFPSILLPAVREHGITANAAIKIQHGFTVL